MVCSFSFTLKIRDVPLAILITYSIRSKYHIVTKIKSYHIPKMLIPYQIGKFAECAGDLSFVQIACAAVFVSLNNSSIVSFCCFTKISRLELRLKLKVRGREIGRARQTFQSGFHMI